MNWSTGVWEVRGGGGVCCAEGGAGGVAAWRGVGVAAFGIASGVTGDGAGLLDVNTPFWNAIGPTLSNGYCYNRFEKFLIFKL